MGRLNRDAIGWSRRPLHRCNIRGRWLAKKRWNYWAVTTENHLFSATVADLDYVGLVFIYFADFDRGELIEKKLLTPLGRGCRMPETVDQSLRFDHREISTGFEHKEGKVRLTVEAADLGGKHLSAEFDIKYPNHHETLNLVVPWSNHRFQFTSKHNTLPARGSVRLGSRETPFDGLQSFACLDYGRGVWPRRCAWNWGSASGTRDGRTIGLNLGGKWTDGTGMTENALCIDGRLSKVSEDLVWEYDPSDFMKPWRVQARQTGQVNLTFTPILERADKSELGLIRSEGHQLFGSYNGIVTTSDGEHIAIGDLIGWAEEHIARW